MSQYVCWEHGTTQKQVISGCYYADRAAEEYADWAAGMDEVEEGKELLVWTEAPSGSRRLFRVRATATVAFEAEPIEETDI